MSLEVAEFAYTLNVLFHHCQGGQRPESSNRP